MLILQRVNSLFRSSSKWKFHPSTNGQNRSIDETKAPTNIKEVRHFLDLTGFYRKFICNYSDIAHPLNCLTKMFQPFIWTADCQYSFNILCSQLVKTPIVQFPDPNKPYLLFMDASKHCYSDIFTQASMDESNEALVQLLSNNNPLTSVTSQTQDLKLNSNSLHHVAYISGSFTKSQCRWPTITKECFGIFMLIKNAHFA